MKKNWYRIENNASADEATCYIYDEIGGWGITANQFCQDLNTITAKTITLKMNSPGGNVFDGTTIHNALKDHPACVNVQVDGLAASIASVIAMAGDKITMAKNAMMMIHNAWSGIYGNAEEMRKCADVLDKIDGTLGNTYADRTGCGKRAIKAMMNDETWMTADECLKNGFCDCVGNQTDAKASFDLSKFNHVPESARAMFAMKRDEPATEREIEALLRDAGVPIAKAKAAVAAIKVEPLRDVEDSTEALNNLAMVLQLQNLAASIH